jgi:hypothetical protein
MNIIMNIKIASKTITYALSAVLLLCTAGLASADTLVTFQVDMTAQVQGASFNPSTDTVYARGSFNGWPAAAGLILTNNPSASNTNLYTGTYDDTADVSIGNVQWKFATSAIGLETTGAGTYNGPNDNRAARLPATSGSSLVLPIEFFSDAGSPILSPTVFRVNMAQQIALGTFNTNTMTVEAFGDFEGFTVGSDPLTNDPTILTTNQFSLVTSNVYVGTYNLVGSPGAINEFKYIINNAGTPIYEAPATANQVGGYQNRYAFVSTNALQILPTIGNQVQPIIDFGDSPYAPIVTNNTLFSVDMTAQVLSGASATNGSVVRLSGDFNGWDAGNPITTSTIICTNNPSNPYVYSAVVSNMIYGVGASPQFKFGYTNGIWENNPTATYPGNPTVFSGGNRNFQMPNVNHSTVTLPTVYFDDVSRFAVLPAPTTVTFTVNMTNAVGTDAVVFNPSVDSVYLNGLVLTNPISLYSFAPWTNSPAGNPLGAFQMVNNPPGSELYTFQLTIPGGYPVMLSYQYSINGNPDEAVLTNHIRYIRSTGSYNIFDTFGSMVQEQSFGNLAVGPKSGANIPITWLGRPGVHLQVETNLTSQAWQDLNNTDAQNTTNYPVGPGAAFFRLINPF